MKERGIIMSGDSPKLILEGRKTQTRRIVKPQPEADWKPLGIGVYNPAKVAKDGEEYPGKEVFGMWDEDDGFVCPYGVVGDRLWVREKFQLHFPATGEVRVTYGYGADRFVDPKNCGDILDDGHWRPSIHMYRWASRITLEIKKLRVERLQDISEEDAMAEGIHPNRNGEPQTAWSGDNGAHWHSTAVAAYRDLWDGCHGKGAWVENPWVWVIGFQPLRRAA